MKVLMLSFLFIFQLGHLQASSTKYIDKRNQGENSDYEVHFCSRPSPGFFGKPGHVYVGFYSKNRTTQKMSFRAFGATAKSILDIFDGSGYLDPEYKSHIRQDCLVVQVNKDLYQAAWLSAKPLFTAPEFGFWNYDLIDSSCVDFSRKVANSLGLTTGDEDVPFKFIENLKKNNN